MGNDCQPGCECKTGGAVNLRCYKCGADTGSPYAGICCTCDSIRQARLKCATEGCKLLRRDGGKSKYCPACAKVARANWRSMVADKAAERDARDDIFQHAWEEAEAAASLASAALVPTPMVVVEADLLGRPIPGAKRYEVSEGACGFAWVSVRPANSAFANWCKRTGKAKRRDYGGGLTIAWCPGGNTQSIERHDAAARAFADVLTEHLTAGGVLFYNRKLSDAENRGRLGIFAQSRMD